MKSKEIEQLPMVNRRFEQIFHRDYRQCECEMPMVTKKWNDALGTFVALRLCCLAKAVEKLTGQKLYEVYEFDPKWVWDCDELHQSIDPQTDCVTLVERGSPPRWLLKRLRDKGIPVLNLEHVGG